MYFCVQFYAAEICQILLRLLQTCINKKRHIWQVFRMARLVRVVLEFNTMIQPQIDFCCFRLVAINIALTHCYKLVSFLNLANY